MDWVQSLAASHTSHEALRKALHFPGYGIIMLAFGLSTRTDFKISKNLVKRLTRLRLETDGEKDGAITLCMYSKSQALFKGPDLNQLIFSSLQPSEVGAFALLLFLLYRERN